MNEMYPLFSLSLIFNYFSLRYLQLEDNFGEDTMKETDDNDSSKMHDYSLLNSLKQIKNPDPFLPAINTSTSSKNASGHVFFIGWDLPTLMIPLNKCDIMIIGEQCVGERDRRSRPLV